VIKGCDESVNMGITEESKKNFFIRTETGLGRSDRRRKKSTRP
jgi:hypothetical protein